MASPKKKKRSKIDPKKLKAPKSKTGRPSDFNPDYIEVAYNLCLCGAVDADLAIVFNVNRDTITEWKKKHPDFSVAITRAKQVADGKIARSLFERAQGFSWQEEIAIKYKKAKDVEDVKVVTVTRTVPPDTMACIFWLKNRQRRNWREKVDPTLPGNKQKAPIIMDFKMDRDIKQEDEES